MTCSQEPRLPQVSYQGVPLTTDFHEYVKKGEKKPICCDEFKVSASTTGCSTLSAAVWFSTPLGGTSYV